MKVGGCRRRRRRHSLALLVSFPEDLGAASRARILLPKTPQIMSLGTLSERRTVAAANPTAAATPSADVSTPNEVVDDSVVTTTTSNPPNTTTDGLVPKPTPDVVLIPTPTVAPEPTKKTCGYCMAKRVTNLAFQISAVLLVLALSFHLVKKV